MARSTPRSEPGHSDDDTESSAQAAASRVADALATVGNWMFSTATRRRIMDDAGLALSLGDYTLLAQLSLHGPIPMSVMAELMGVDKSTLTPPTKRLEALGMIERTPDPADARSQPARVTLAGKQAIKRLWEARTRAVSELVADWPAEEIAGLGDNLMRLSDEIKKRGQ